MTDLVRRDQTDSWVDVLGAVGDLAGKISNTEFVPKSLRGRAPAVAAAILAGRERGLPPMVSLASIDVVDGRPTLSAQLLAALVYRAGHRITVIESTDKAAEVKIERADGLGEATVRWTLADAQKAGLAGKSNWQKYGRQMLYARALSEAARMACPDVALGLDVEMMSDPDDPPRRPTVVQLQPQPDPEPAPTEPETGPIVSETAPNGDQNPPPTPQLPPGLPPELPPAEPLISGPQMRKLGALIGQWEHLHQMKLDRDQRRALIRNMAAVDHLESAKDLTRDQASAAIEALHLALQIDTLPTTEEAHD
jgi:hypothetical protein